MSYHDDHKCEATEPHVGASVTADVARLEFEVVQAAIKWTAKFAEGLETNPFAAELTFAVDALIEARKQVETQVLYSQVPSGLGYCVDHKESHTDCAVARAMKEEEKGCPHSQSEKYKLDVVHFGRCLQCAPLNKKELAELKRRSPKPD